MSRQGPLAIGSFAVPAAELRGVAFRYPNSTNALEQVDLVIEPRDFLGLVGPNGGGKTTLLKLLLGLLTPQQGTVRVFGRDPSQVRDRIGYVPQHSMVDAAVPADVLDVVLMGRLASSSWGPGFGQRQVGAAYRALEQTRCEDLARRRFGELSGGQRQRVMIARALAADAELLLLDEATTGIDLHREKELLSLLHQLNERLTIVLVSHDIALVSSHLKRAAWVHRRLSVYPASELSLEVVEALYHGIGDGGRRG